MDVKDAIKKRKSIRKYSDKAVTNDLINELIESLRLSPSAYNAQPWKYKIINDKKTIEKLREEQVFKNEFVYTAPLIIVCCGDINMYPEIAKESFDLKKLCYGDIGISTQNMVLRATELGLGTCYVGLINRKKLKNILNIPENYIIPYIITIGNVDASETPRSPGRKNKEDIIF
jgi:nitroreductase